jgi:hypothetical protein
MTITADTLIRAAHRLAIASRALPFDRSREWQYIAPDWEHGWEPACAALRTTLGSEAESVLALVHDRGAPPHGYPIVSVPLDAISTAGALALERAGWTRVIVERVWPLTGGTTGTDGTSEPTTAARAAVIEAHARANVWTFYESTTWGFIFPLRPRRRTRSAPRTTT